VNIGFGTLFQSLPKGYTNDMALDLSIPRETLVESVAGALPVLAFVAAIIFIGATYDSRGLEETGAIALVGAITLFVLTMAVVGIFLSRYEGSESDD
jgi:hypothetical protein